MSTIINIDYNWRYLNEMQYAEIQLTRFEYGMKELTKVISLRKRGLITKSEYNAHRNGIEKDLLKL
jgi:hypothetical protein